MRKVVTFLWLENGAGEAVEHYQSIFGDNLKVSYTTRHTEATAEMAGVKAGDVQAIDFELFGQNFSMLNGGPTYKLNEAASIMVLCKDQAEIDKYWDALSEGGKTLSCGWLTDKFGVTWQIVPDNLDEMLRDPDHERANRVSEVMLSMEGKLDLHELERAYSGE